MSTSFLRLKKWVLWKAHCDWNWLNRGVHKAVGCKWAPYTRQRYRQYPTWEVQIWLCSARLLLLKYVLILCQSHPWNCWKLLKAAESCWKLLKAALLTTSTDTETLVWMKTDENITVFTESPNYFLSIHPHLASYAQVSWSSPCLKTASVKAKEPCRILSNYPHHSPVQRWEPLCQFLSQTVSFSIRIRKNSPSQTVWEHGK